MSLRDDALACFREAVAAVEPSRLVAEFLARHPDIVPPGSRVRIAAVGKAAAAMTRGALEALPGRVDGGVVILPAGTEHDLPPEFTVYGGGHPVPNEEGVRGARAAHRLAEGLGGDDVLLCLISGGGSALMTLPPDGLTLADVQSTTGELLRAGAEIGELNCVRKHLDQLKGGRLAAAAAAARIVALVLSDVVGDPLDVIASGPVTPDPSTATDALGVLERRGVTAAVPEAVRAHLTSTSAESPKPDDRCFARVETRVIGNNRIAAEAAAAEAARRGYAPLLLSTVVTGEARGVGRMLAALGQEIRRSASPLAAPACLLAAGETTVTVTGRGKGGRNQEVALGAAVALDALEGSEGILVASFGTDGIDGPTDAAGATAAADTVRRGRELGLDAARALADNGAYPFFEALGDLVVTGPTGTNVMDLMLVLVSP